MAKADEGRLFLYCVYIEAVKLLRVPAFSVPVLLFPILFFLMFGYPFAGERYLGLAGSGYVVVAYGAYAVMSIGLFSFGISISAERMRGYDRLLRVAPMPIGIYFAAKILMAMFFGATSLLVLFTVAAFITDFPFAPALWVKLAGVLASGMVSFVGLGLFLGYLVGPNAVAGIANLIFLPSAFCSGIFIPLELLPKAIQELSVFMPPYHVAQLGWQVLAGQSLVGMAPNFAVLWIYAIGFLVLGVYSYRRENLSWV